MKKFYISFVSSKMNMLRVIRESISIVAYGAALRALNKLNQRSEGMAIVIQNPDGSWPKFDLNKYGSGIFAIGKSEPDWH